MLLFVFYNNVCVFRLIYIVSLVYVLVIYVLGVLGLTPNSWYQI